MSSHVALFLDCHANHFFYVLNKKQHNIIIHAYSGRIGLLIHSLLELNLNIGMRKLCLLQDESIYDYLCMYMYVYVIYKIFKWIEDKSLCASTYRSQCGDSTVVVNYCHFHHLHITRWAIMGDVKDDNLLRINSDHPNIWIKHVEKIFWNHRIDDIDDVTISDISVDYLIKKNNWLPPIDVATWSLGGKMAVAWPYVSWCFAISFGSNDGSHDRYKWYKDRPKISKDHILNYHSYV